MSFGWWILAIALGVLLRDAVMLLARKIEK